MKHIAYITHQPEHVPTQMTPDGAITGNGDLGVVFGRWDDALTIYLSKCDFWKAETGNYASSGIRVAGILSLYVPDFTSPEYRVEQDMDSAVLRAEFKKGGVTVRLELRACAVENAVLTDISIDGLDEKAAAGCKFSVKCPDGDNSIVRGGVDGDVHWATRRWEDASFDYLTAICLARKTVFAERGGKSLRERRIIYAVTNHDSAAYKLSATGKAYMADDGEYGRLMRRHAAWWAEFWAKSSVSIADGDLENNWYSNQYICACCMRNAKFAPGLFGNFITADNPAWHGDIHLNYNYQAPFYGLVSSNHVELTDCYDGVIEDAMPQASRNARELFGVDGILYAVGIGPLGLDTSMMSGGGKFDNQFWGQKSNGAYAAVVNCMRWYGTRDKKYAAAHGYPLILRLCCFWESYLVWEDGRYVIYNDAIHETSFDRRRLEADERYVFDFNPLLSLGFVRMLMKCALDMSEALGEDESRREKWRHILAHISDYPTFEKGGKTVFRYTEKGMEWNNGNGLHIQHIYPAGQIGQSSPPELLEVAKNTFNAAERWADNNACSSVYPCAARLCVDPKLIIGKFHECMQRRQFENMLFDFGGGGIENNSVVSATVNEMLLQGYEGVLRVFPDWDRDLDVRFENLRADGAFLVSAEMKGGEIGGVRIISEAGTPLTVENPWDGEFTVSSDGKTTVTSEKTVTIETKPGCVIYLARHLN